MIRFQQICALTACVMLTFSGSVFAQSKKLEDVTVQPNLLVRETIHEEVVTVKPNEYKHMPFKALEGDTIIIVQANIDPNWIDPPVIGFCTPEQMSVLGQGHNTLISTCDAASMYATGAAHAIYPEAGKEYHLVIYNGKYAEQRTIDLRLDAHRPFETSIYASIPGGFQSLNNLLHGSFKDFSLNWNIISCQRNAFYTPYDNSITFCAEWIADLNDVTSEGETWPLIPIALHEVAHGLLDQWDLPGSQIEEMADELGTVLLFFILADLPVELESQIQGAVKFWKKLTQTDLETAQYLSEVYGPHPLAVQRGRKLVIIADNRNFFMNRWLPILRSHVKDSVLSSLGESEFGEEVRKVAMQELNARRGERFAQAQGVMSKSLLVSDEVTLPSHITAKTLEEFSLWLANFEDPGVLQDIGEQPLLSALVLDYIEAIGAPQSFQDAVNDKTAICMTACQEYGESQIDLGDRITASDFLKMVMSTKFGYLDERDRRWAALKRIDAVIGALGVADTELTEEDAEYLTGEFRELLKTSTTLSSQKYENIDQLVEKATRMLGR